MQAYTRLAYPRDCSALRLKCGRIRSTGGNMSLTAVRTDTGEQITVGEISLEELRALSGARCLHCPGCGSPLTLKAGTVRLPHFAHLSECTIPHYEPESESHRMGKWALYQHFRVGALAAGLEHGFPETDQRADVFIETSTTLHVLEFQQANNSFQEWLDRHQRYQRLGVVDTWFLGVVRYREMRGEPLRPISPYDPLPVPRGSLGGMAGGFGIREMERAILNTCAQSDHLPMLIYLDPQELQVTLLLAREIRGMTLRAYRYRVPLAQCALREGQLWTPLTPLLEPHTHTFAAHWRTGGR